MDIGLMDWIVVGLWAITLIVGLRTLHVYRRQLQVMDQSLRAQNLAWLVQYLQAPDVRHARFIAMTKLSRKRFARWSFKEQEEAATALAAYGVAGVYIQSGRVDRELILQNWGPSIKRLGAICDEFIEDRIQKSAPNYWGALTWIIAEANKAS